MAAAPPLWALSKNGGRPPPSANPGWGEAEAEAMSAPVPAAAGQQEAAVTVGRAPPATRRLPGTGGASRGCVSDRGRVGPRATRCPCGLTPRPARERRAGPRSPRVLAVPSAAGGRAAAAPSPPGGGGLPGRLRGAVSLSSLGRVDSADLQAVERAWGAFCEGKVWCFEDRPHQIGINLSSGFVSCGRRVPWGEERRVLSGEETQRKLSLLVFVGV